MSETKREKREKERYFGEKEKITEANEHDKKIARRYWSRRKKAEEEKERRPWRLLKYLYITSASPQSNRLIVVSLRVCPFDSTNHSKGIEKQKKQIVFQPFRSASCFEKVGFCAERPLLHDVSDRTEGKRERKSLWSGTVDGVILICITFDDIDLLQLLIRTHTHIFVCLLITLIDSVVLGTNRPSTRSVIDNWHRVPNEFDK